LPELLVAARCTRSVTLNFRKSNDKQIQVRNGRIFVSARDDRHAKGCRRSRNPIPSGQGATALRKVLQQLYGLQLTGSDKGPPLLHPFYKPSHHGDQSFYRAALQGVQQHHWEFGNMPPVEGMTAKKMDSLVPYVRYNQQQKKLY